MIEGPECLSQEVLAGHRYDKKAAKYTTPVLPFPYDSVATYERSMRHPLGSDFNTSASFK